MLNKEYSFLGMYINVELTLKVVELLILPGLDISDIGIINLFFFPVLIGTYINAN